MNENEKQAYNYLEKYIKWETYGERNLERDIKTILNLIDKQQKELEKLRNPVICGKNIDEIVNILMALDIEKQYKIEVTMENLKSLMEIYQSEVEKSIHDIQIKNNFDGENKYE